MSRRYTDNALTTLAGALAIGGTTLTVLTGKGDNFPSIAGRGAAGSALDYFVITMEDSAGNREKIKVEERAGGSDVLGSAGYPLARGYDGTAPRAWAAGDLVDLRIERKGIQEELTDLVAADAPARLFGPKASTTSGLNFGYYGGQMWVDGVLTTIADGLIALTASVTNYIEHDRAGVVSKNAVGFSADRFPIAEVVTNTVLMTSVTDRRIANRPQVGRLVKSVAGGAGTTVLTAAEARNDILEFTGALTGNRTIEVPTMPRVWIVFNNTTGAFTLTVKTAAGTGIAVPQGKRLVLLCDGTNVERSLTSIDGMLGGTLATALNLVVGGTAVPTIVKRKTADESVTSSATLQDDNHLTFAIGANEEWCSEFLISATGKLGVSGIKIAVTTPAGATQDIDAFIVASDGGGADEAAQERTTASGTAIDFEAARFSALLTGTFSVRVKVWVLNAGTAGNVTLQWAQSTSNANAITFFKGSYMPAHRIA